MVRFVVPTTLNICPLSQYCTFLCSDFSFTSALSVCSIHKDGHVCPHVPPSHTCELFIKGMAWENNFKYESNVHLDLKMNVYDFGGQRSMSLWHYIHLVVVNVIMQECVEGISSGTNFYYRLSFFLINWIECAAPKLRSLWPHKARRPVWGCNPNIHTLVMIRIHLAQVMFWEA